VHRDRVLALRRECGESESVIITRLGMIDERDMAQCLAELLEIPLARPGDYPAARCGPIGLTAEFVARAQALPLKETDDGLVLAMADPTDDYTLKAVRLAAGGAVLPWAAVPSELKAAFARLYGDDALGRGAVAARARMSVGSPTPRAKSRRSATSTS
jgi:general secretion pathway protein E